MSSSSDSIWIEMSESKKSNLSILTAKKTSEHKITLYSRMYIIYMGQGTITI